MQYKLGFSNVIPLLYCKPRNKKNPNHLKKRIPLSAGKVFLIMGIGIISFTVLN